MSPRTAVFILFAALFVGAGCTSSRTVGVAQWQKDVEHYVRAHDDDPTVLADVTLPGTARAGFAAIGSPDAKNSSDVSAVLLAHRVVDSQPWFIYLVGSIEREQVREIRLAGLSFREDRFNWKQGPADASALQTYLGASHRVPRMFPQEGDTFDVEISGAAVTATHRQSGARWELNLDENRRNSRTARASE